MKTDFTVGTGSIHSDTGMGAYRVEDQYLFGEEYFHQLLSLERKRTERSGNPSLLMLIDLRDFSGHSERICIVEKVNILLSSMLRDTDVRGWYARDWMGIILTEIGHCDLLDSKERILAQIQGRSGINNRSDSIPEDSGVV